MLQNNKLLSSIFQIFLLLFYTVYFPFILYYYFYYPDVCLQPAPKYHIKYNVDDEYDVILCDQTLIIDLYRLKQINIWKMQWCYNKNNKWCNEKTTFLSNVYWYDGDFIVYLNFSCFTSSRLDAIGDDTLATLTQYLLDVVLLRWVVQTS